MRFTIRRLMLLPIAFLLVTWLVGFFAFPALRSFAWQHETNSITHAQEWIESAVRYCEHADIMVTDQTLKDWTVQRLSPEHPAAESLMDPPRPDAGGNPYRIQRRQTLEEKPRVYSTGEDGLSRSEGNDPDDMRRWDEKRWL